MKKEPNVDGAYALNGPEDAQKLYRDWAESYDTGFGQAQGYRLPVEVARIFLDAGGTGPVLDVGAGTGLVAKALNSAGIDSIDGLDLSAEMLEVARRKRLYRHLFTRDVTQPLEALSGPYQGVVSAGTFTLGHVGPEGLPPLLEVAADGALFVISVNAAHFESAGFAAFLEGAAGRIDGLRSETVRIYDDRADPAHRMDMAWVLVFRKR